MRDIRFLVRPRGLGRAAERSGVPLFLVALVLLFIFDPTTSENFRSAGNLENIFANQSVTGLIALASVIPMVAGYIDLSVAGIAGLANVVAAAIIGTYHQSVLVGLVAGVAIAALVGAINGVLIAMLRLNPFICTLGVYIFIGGILELYTKGQTISNGLPVSMSGWDSAKWLGVAQPFWLLLVVAVVAWYVLTQTPFGRKLAAIGSNEPAARLAGFRVDRAVFVTFLLSGLLGGVAGDLLTAQTLGADATTGASYLFPALAAVFLGQTAIRPGQFNVWGTIFGVFLVAVAVDGFTLLGAQAWVDQVFNGGALVVSVAFSTLMARARDRRARTEAMRAMQDAGSPAQHHDTQVPDVSHADAPTADV
jgi:ribose transport system permease protein